MLWLVHVRAREKSIETAWEMRHNRKFVDKMKSYKILNLGLAKYIFLPNFIDEKNINCINKYIDHYFQTWSKYNYNIFLWTGLFDSTRSFYADIFSLAPNMFASYQNADHIYIPKELYTMGGCYCVHYTVKYYYELFSEHLNAFKLNCVNWSELTRSSV